MLWVRASKKSCRERAWKDLALRAEPKQRLIILNTVSTCHLWPYLWSFGFLKYCFIFLLQYPDGGLFVRRPISGGKKERILFSSLQSIWFASPSNPASPSNLSTGTTVFLSVGFSWRLSGFGPLVAWTPRIRCESQSQIITNLGWNLANIALFPSVLCKKYWLTCRASNPVESILPRLSFFFFPYGLYRFF